MFPTQYEDALEEWVQVREQANGLPLEESLHTIHDWWQQLPIVNHNLHIADYKDWPSPWDLLADNNHCEVAKALQMCYTLLIIDRPEINSMNLICDDNYTYIQILTHDKEYVLNDQPGNITADLTEVRVLHTIDCDYFRTKI